MAILIICSVLSTTSVVSHSSVHELRGGMGEDRIIHIVTMCKIWLPYLCVSQYLVFLFFFSRSWNGGYLEMSQYFCVVKMFFFFFFLIACMLLCVCVWSLSHAQLFATLWTVACQAPLSMQFLKNTGVGCHCFLQGIFPTQGSKQHFLHCTAFLALQENSLPTEPLGKHSMLMTSGIIQMWNQVRIFINNF